MNGEFPFPEAGRLLITRDCDVTWLDIEVDPRRGRRKARVYCHVCGCKSHIIHGYVTCQKHWRLASKPVRDELTDAIRQCKTLWRMTGFDGIEWRFAIGARDDACLALVNAIQDREIERTNHVKIE